MSHTRTARTAQATSSTDEKSHTVTINLTAPTSWQELSQEQLRYVLKLLTAYADRTAIKTMMFVRFCGLDIQKRTRYGWKCLITVDGKKRVVYLQSWQVQSFIHQFDFIDTYEDMDCRLDAVCGLVAVDPLLHEVSFGDYLMAEKYYQIYLSTKDEEMLDHLACWLYVDANGLHPGQERGSLRNDTEMVLKPEERLGTFAWYSHVKKVLFDRFPNFFQKVDGEDGDFTVTGRQIEEQYNIQLRALTDGDPTKESAVLALDCWRALTELDAKAREAEELEKMRNKQ